MDVTVEDLSSVKKMLHIQIPEEDVANELEKAYNNLKKTVKVKGFRPGKVPRTVLEGLFKKDVHAQVSTRLLQNSFMEAIKKTELNIVGNPRIDPPELDAKGPYKYNATVEINPEIKEIDFKGLTLKKLLYRVSEEEVRNQLKMLQKKLARLKIIEEDRPVQDGDFVLIDYEGFKDGEPFAETQKTENFGLKIGDGRILKDFDEKLIGMKPGDTKEIKVHFPDNYFNKKLADLEISFRVILKEIREEVLPEIDDEFAKQLGDYNTLEELKNAITDNLKEGYAKRVEQELNEQIFEALIAKTEFEVPESLIDYELGWILSDAERSFAQYNMTMEELGLTRESLSEKYRDIAEKQARRHLILNKIIEQESLTLSDEDLEKGFKEMSEISNQPLEQIKNYYEQNNDKLNFFKQALLEKQAIRLIIDNSRIEEMELEASPQSENNKADNDKSVS